MLSAFARAVESFFGPALQPSASLLRVAATVAMIAILAAPSSLCVSRAGSRARNCGPAAEHLDALLVEARAPAFGVVWQGLKGFRVGGREIAWKGSGGFAARLLDRWARPLVPMPTMIYLHVPDVDAVYRSAVAAGATSVLARTDQPYRDRSAGVRDPLGHTWYIATPIR